MTTIGQANTTHNSINDLIKNTILDVEKVLNRLPTSDDRLHVTTMFEDKALNDVDIFLGGDVRARGPVTKNIRIFPMADKNGMVFEMMICLHKKEPEETQLMDIRVECPKIKPNRIRVDGQWYNIL